MELSCAGVDYALVNQGVIGARLEDGGCERYCLEIRRNREKW